VAKGILEKVGRDGLHSNLAVQLTTTTTIIITTLEFMPPLTAVMSVFLSKAN
jgi:hypothetical protein